MIPVDQTVNDGIAGNCLSACVASILELSIEDVPSFHDLDWRERWAAWADERGVTIRCLGTTSDRALSVGYWIGFVASPNWPGKRHAVVMRGLELAHDPATPKKPLDMTTLGEGFVIET